MAPIAIHIGSTLNESAHMVRAALDSDGRKHIAYVTQDGSEIRYRKEKANGTWQEEVIADTYPTADARWGCAQVREYRIVPGSS